MINAASSSSTTKHFLSARPSILQDFPSKTEEQRFRKWLYVHHRSLPARFALFCVTVVGVVQQVLSRSWEGMPDDQYFFFVSSTLLWTCLLFALCVLPSKYCKCIQLINHAVYVLNVLTVIGAALTSNAFKTFSIATLTSIVLVMQPYTWKAKLPFFLVAVLATASRGIADVESTWISATFFCCSFVVLLWQVYLLVSVDNFLVHSFILAV